MPWPKWLGGKTTPLPTPSIPPEPPETDVERENRIALHIKTRFDAAMSNGGKFVLIGFDWENEKAREFVKHVTQLAKEHPLVSALQFVHLEGNFGGEDEEKDVEDVALLTLKQN